MTQARPRQGRWWAALAALVSIASLFALSSASSAQAEEVQFCWGKNFPKGSGLPEQLCFSGGYNLGTVYASGVSGAVCAGAWEMGDVCETKANTGVWLEHLNGAYTRAYIRNKSNEATKAYGKLWTATPPPPPPPAPSWYTDNLGAPAGGLTFDPDIVNKGGYQEVFARGSGGDLVHKYWTGSSWSGWSSLGGSIVGSPKAAAYGSNRIDVVGRTSSNTVAHWYYTGSAWYYDDLGAPAGGITSNPEIVIKGGNQEVFARGSGGDLVHMYWYGSSWSGWSSLGGSFVGSPGAESSASNRIDVVARTSSNTVAHWYYTGTAWYQDNLGGTITADPDIATKNGYQEVFARGASGELVHSYWYGGWSSWSSLGGSPVTAGVGAAGSSNGRLDVVGRDVNGNVAHWWYQ